MNLFAAIRGEATAIKESVIERLLQVLAQRIAQPEVNRIVNILKKRNII